MKNKKVISITVSKTVYDNLSFLRNKSRIVNGILEKLFEGITEKEIKAF